MDTILVIALAWTVGSVTAAVALGRWLKARPLAPAPVRVEQAEAEADDPPFSRTQFRAGIARDDAQPTSGMNTISRSGSGRARRSSRSA